MKEIDEECSLCGKEASIDVNICAVHYYFCELCHKKLYYHYVGIIIKEIKHPK